MASSCLGNGTSLTQNGSVAPRVAERRALLALLSHHFKGYKEESGTFRKTGSYLIRPEYRFKSEHKMVGTVYWVKLIN